MLLGQFGGIRFKLNYLFLVIIALASFVGVLPQVLLLFTMVLLHEVVHITVAQHYGIRVRELELFPFGGVAHLDDLLELDPAVETKVALAGPAANLALAVLGLGMEVITEGGLFWGFFWRVNTTLGLFNLLPALPLDGGRIYRAWSARWVGFRQATIQAAEAGRIFAVALAGAGLIGLFFVNTGLELIIAAVFLFQAADKEQRLAPYLFIRYLKHRRGELLRWEMLQTKVLTAVPWLLLEEVVNQFIPRCYHVILVVEPKQGVMGVITEDQLVDALFNKGGRQPVGELLAGKN